ncbi:MAG TPA: serine/threonine-protein kinase, partial [Aggregatilineaceae bacterium]|nr:serine/threonine-protein kinase [Aggregatilineaceae bacterium]
MEASERKRFGRYEVIGELGRGAMGVVYKARDPQIDRFVAVKTVSLRGQEPEDAAEFRKRFMNEAQAAGRLHHPGIVSVFDVGEEEDTSEPYIVLEYVSGEALNKVLAREKKLDLTRALQIAQEIAEALEYAHAQGVTHRDVKPGNILLTQDGHAKIADFGIAKLNLAHFTLPGKVLGTPAYMAPEQLSGEGADGRSDLFSLGVILYAMVVGHSPFQGNSATTVCFKVANREPVPASALDLNLPQELDAIIAHAMAKDPDERYQTGSEFANDLKLLQAQLKPASSTTSMVAPGTRKTTQRITPKPSPEPISAMAFVQNVLRTAPVRDLVLGAATVVLLVIVGVQTKVLVFNRQQADDPDLIRAAQIHASTSQASLSTDAKPATEVPVAPPVAAKAAPRKVSAKARKPAGTEVVVPSCSVELAVRHQFKDATLSVWIDDTLALSRPLHGGTQKRLVVFNGVRGFESETLKVPA